MMKMKYRRWMKGGKGRNFESEKYFHSKFQSEFSWFEVARGYSGRRCLNLLPSNSFHEQKSENISNLRYNKKRTSD